MVFGVLFIVCCWLTLLWYLVWICDFVLSFVLVVVLIWCFVFCLLFGCLDVFRLPCGALAISG